MRRQISTPIWFVRMEKRLGEGGERDDMDERGRWLEKMKDPRGDYVVDLVPAKSRHALTPFVSL